MGDNIKLDLQEVRRGTWTGLIWLRKGQVAGCCECGNERPGYVKCGEFVA